MAKYPKKPKLMNLQEMRDRIGELFEKFQSESERGLALVGSALLDDVLREKLKERLVDDSDVIKSSFDPDRFLGTFASRTKLAYLLGMFGPKTYETINTIREVRNRFAHLHQIAKFADPEIAAMCLGLFPRFTEFVLESETHPTVTDPRRRFGFACAVLIVEMLESEPVPRLALGPDRQFFSEDDEG